MELKGYTIILESTVSDETFYHIAVMAKTEQKALDLAKASINEETVLFSMEKKSSEGVLLKKINNGYI